MKTFSRLRNPVCRDFGLAALGRWVLVLLLAFDLIGSPLHAHHHDLGTDGLVSQAHHAAGVPHGWESAHFDADDASAFGHSLTGLLPAQPQPGKWQATAHAAVYAPPSASGAATPTPLRAAWRDSRERIPILLRSHLRPDSRAPPVLHV